MRMAMLFAAVCSRSQLPSDGAALRDNTCDSFEDCRSCPVDCDRVKGTSRCPTVCGDFHCDALQGETVANCRGDCLR